MVTVSITNLQTYRYYRFIAVSGNAAGSMVYEVEFLISTDLCQSSSWSSQSSMACLTLEYPPYPSFLDITVGALVGTGKAIFTFDGTALPE